MCNVKPDEAQLNACAAVVQKSIEWTSKVDLAQIEAGGKEIAASFAAIDETIKQSDAALRQLFQAIDRIKAKEQQEKAGEEKHEG